MFQNLKRWHWQSWAFLDFLLPLRNLKKDSPAKESSDLNKIAIKFSDYTMFPGGRYSSDGEGNATDFRKKFLVPPLKDNQYIVLNLDGVIGYPAAFLDEAFGGLVRDEGFDSKFVEEHIELEANESGFSGAIRLIKKYINSPDDLMWMKTKRVNPIGKKEVA